MMVWWGWLVVAYAAGMVVTLVSLMFFMGAGRAQ